MQIRNLIHIFVLVMYCASGTKLLIKDVQNFVAGFLQVEDEGKMKGMDKTWSNVQNYKNAFPFGPVNVLQHQQTGDLLWEKLIWTDEKNDIKLEGNSLQTILRSKGMLLVENGQQEIQVSKWIAVFMWFYKGLHEIVPNHPFVQSLVLAIAEQIDDIEFRYYLPIHKKWLRFRNTPFVTPLILAVETRSENAVNELIRRGVNVDAADADGLTPFHLAAIRGLYGCCKKLSDNKARFEWGGNVEVRTELCQCGSAYPHKGEKMWTQEYRTPLMSACIHGKTNVVELLLRLKVEPDRLSWKVAREKGYTEITDMFADAWDEVNLWELEEQTLKEKLKNGNCFNKCLII